MRGIEVVKLRAVGRADLFKFKPQKPQALFEVGDLEHQEMFKRVNGLGIDLPQVIRIDACLLVPKQGPQGVDIFRADFLGGKRRAEGQADFVHGGK